MSPSSGMAVSTKDQFLDRHITALTEAGCIRIFAYKKPGKNVETEELRKALDYLREGGPPGRPVPGPARPPAQAGPAEPRT